MCVCACVRVCVCVRACMCFSDQQPCFVRVLLTGAVCVCGSVVLGSPTMLRVGLADWDCVCVCVHAYVCACVCVSWISDHASCGSC